MYKSFLSALILFSSTAIYAQNQEDFKLDGFIVMKGTTDTIQGKMKERNSYIAQNMNVWFMFPDGRMEKFKRRDLAAAGIENDLYIIVEKLPNGQGTQMLQVLVRGTVTLYQVVVDSNPTYFMMKEGQEKMQVITTIPKGRGYKDQKKLMKYFKDDTEISAKIKSKEYTPVLTPALVREYNARHPHTGNGLHY